MSSLKPYYYLTLKYIHDQGAGESLNIGVLMFSLEGEFLDLKLEQRYERLSQTFSGFYGDHYRRALARIRAAVIETKKRWNAGTLLADPPQNIADVLNGMWTDRDTSFQWTEPRGGITADYATELQQLFERMVISVAPQQDDVARHDDEYIWRNLYQRKLGPVVQSLRPKRFVTEHLDIEFDRALKNGAWHVIQPVSFDYKSAESMQLKATQWLGTAVGLKEAVDLAGIYFLLGRPSDPAHRRSYERAKALLDQAPVPHELLEEEDAPELARKLEDLIRHE